MKKKTVIALALVGTLVLTTVSGQLAMTVNAAGNDVVSDSEESDNCEETEGTDVEERKQEISELADFMPDAPEPQEESPEASNPEEEFEPQIIYEPEEMPSENGQETFTQKHTQVFEEPGIQVSILSEGNIIPEDAVIRIAPVEGIESEDIEEAVQWMAEDVLEEKIRKAENFSLSIFNMYADLEVSGSSSYAFQVEISYQDEQGNDCILRPEENDSIQVLVELLSPEEKLNYYSNTSGDQLQSVEIFALSQDGAAAFSADSVGSPSIYTFSIVRYAARADPAMIAAEQKAWNIINTYADQGYFLSDPYKGEMTEEQYEELHQAALTATTGCKTQYEKIKEITRFVADRTYYDYYYLADKKNHPTYFNPYEVYTNKRTVCSGYARLMRTLCVSLGIPCMDIIGDNHEYNAIYDKEQNKWIFADATWCSWNKYTVEQQWVYGGYTYMRFDLRPEEIALLTSHEVYGVDGLLDGTVNSVYYYLTAPEENWTQTDNWYLAVSGAKKAKAKAVGSFAGLSVTEVKNWSFNENVFLEELDLSDTKVSGIGYASFYKCSSLKNIVLPAAVTKIDEWAFAQCTNLVEADLSRIAVTEIGAYAFYNCSSIKEVNLSKTKLTSIGRDAFYKCSSLQKVSFPDSLTEIGIWAFGFCEKLTQVDLSNIKITDVADYTFQSCSSLTKVSFPDTLTEIGDRAFGWCKTLSEINLIKTRVKSIGDYAFYDCEAADFITLPSTLTEIGAKAFGYAPKVSESIVITSLSAEAIHYPGGNDEWQSRKDVKIYKHDKVYNGYEFYTNADNGIVCLNSDGTRVINEFICDGTYTYYFQANGTAMRDRLTYHPDGVHVIYFDEKGHEKFDSFALVGYNIPSMETGIATKLNEYCYFNTFGYQYTDVVTYDIKGEKLYYANTRGVLERSGWFEFSKTVTYAGDGKPWSAAGQRGYANGDCTLMKDTFTYDKNGNLCYMQGNGAVMYDF